MTTFETTNTEFNAAELVIVFDGLEAGQTVAEIKDELKEAGFAKAQYNKMRDAGVIAEMKEYIAMQQGALELDEEVAAEEAAEFEAAAEETAPVITEEDTDDLPDSMGLTCIGDGINEDLLTEGCTVYVCSDKGWHNGDFSNVIPATFVRMTKMGRITAQLQGRDKPATYWAEACAI